MPKVCRSPRSSLRPATSVTPILVDKRPFQAQAELCILRRSFDLATALAKQDRYAAYQVTSSSAANARKRGNLCQARSTWDFLGVLPVNLLFPRSGDGPMLRYGIPTPPGGGIVYPAASAVVGGACRYPNKSCTVSPQTAFPCTTIHHSPRDFLSFILYASKRTLITSLTCLLPTHRASQTRSPPSL